MARKLSGGNSQPVFAIEATDLVSNGGQYELESKTALPVWWTAEERPTTGGVAQPVYVVPASDISSGDYKLDGGHALPVINANVYATGRKRGSSKTAIPVYTIGGTAP